MTPSIPGGGVWVLWSLSVSAQGLQDRYARMEKLG
jgi:hypothetical protein